MRRSWLRLFWLTVVIAGAVVGYGVSSGLGTRLLHQEIETQLSRLLQGQVDIVDVEVRWDNGLCVEARGVSAYPGSTPEATPALRARRILAWVDFVSLLIGRLELSTLILEGPHLRAVQNADGTFVGLPLPPISRVRPQAAEDDFLAEQIFAFLGSVNGLATALADQFRAAGALEVIDGTISWIDAASLAGELSPSEVRIELLEGRGERNWLSDAIAVHVKGVVVDGQHTPFPVEIKLDREEGGEFSWSVAVSRIPLDEAEEPLTLVDRLDILTGELDLHIRLDTEAPGLHRFRIEGAITDAEVKLNRSGALFHYDLIDANTEFTISRDQVQVRSARVAGGDLGIELKGAIGRPIRRASPTQIEVRILGLLLEDVAAYARSLESESETLFTIARLTDRVRTGKVDYLETAGAATLGLWSELATGKVRELLSGFVLSGKFHDAVVTADSETILTDLAAELEWVDNQIVVRDGTATYRGKPLPQINAVIEGISYLVDTNESADLLSNPPPPIPGLQALGQIIKPRDPDALPPVKAIGLAIKRLEYPLFRWPFRDLRVLVEPLRGGLEVNIREGTWGGGSVSGEAVWFSDPVTPSVSASITLGAPPENQATTESSTVQDRWGSGQFELEFRPRSWLPFERATGHFRLEGTDLIGDELEFQLVNQGTLAARMTLGLEVVDSVGFDASFALTDGRLAEVGPFIALPSGIATGAIGATGSLAGRLRPDTSLVAELDGLIRAEAAAGQVTTDLPLMFRLAEATEGYNPFAEDNFLDFETMTGSFELTHGLIRVEDFKIEGPLRVFARADIDTNMRPVSIRGVVGIFLFRKPSQLLDNLPLLRSFLPGSERGLIGTYFKVKGPIGEPEVEGLPIQSLMTGVPNVIKAPFKALRFLFDRMAGDD